MSDEIQPSASSPIAPKHWRLLIDTLFNASEAEAAAAFLKNNGSFTQAAALEWLSEGRRAPPGFHSHEDMCRMEDWDTTGRQVITPESPVCQAMEIIIDRSGVDLTWLAKKAPSLTADLIAWSPQALFECMARTSDDDLLAWLGSQSTQKIIGNRGRLSNLAFIIASAAHPLLAQVQDRIPSWRTLKDRQGRTPIFFARTEETLRFLLEAGCEAKVVDAAGNSPSKFWLESYRPAQAQEMVALCEQGADQVIPLLATRLLSAATEPLSAADFATITATDPDQPFFKTALLGCQANWSPRQVWHLAEALIAGQNLLFKNQRVDPATFDVTRQRRGGLLDRSSTNIPHLSKPLSLENTFAYTQFIATARTKMPPRLVDKAAASTTDESLDVKSRMLLWLRQTGFDNLLGDSTPSRPSRQGLPSKGLVRLSGMDNLPVASLAQSGSADVALAAARMTVTKDNQISKDLPNRLNPEYPQGVQSHLQIKGYATIGSLLSLSAAADCRRLVEPMSKDQRQECAEFLMELVNIRSFHSSSHHLIRLLELFAMTAIPADKGGLGSPEVAAKYASLPQTNILRYPLFRRRWFNALSAYKKIGACEFDKDPQAWAPTANMLIAMMPTLKQEVASMEFTLMSDLKNTLPVLDEMDKAGVNLPLVSSATLKYAPPETRSLLERVIFDATRPKVEAKTSAPPRM